MTYTVQDFAPTVRISLACIGLVLLNVAAKSTHQRTKSRTENTTGEKEKRRRNWQATWITGEVRVVIPFLLFLLRLFLSPSFPCTASLSSYLSFDLMLWFWHDENNNLLLRIISWILESWTKPKDVNWMSTVNMLYTLSRLLRNLMRVDTIDFLHFNTFSFYSWRY